MMDYKKLFVAVAAVSAAGLMTACGSDSSSNGGAGGSTTLLIPTSSSNVAGEACSTVGTFSGLDILNADGSYTPLCDLSGTISETATLTSDFAYRLNGYVTVGQGNAELEVDDGDTSKDEPAEVKAAVSEVVLTVNSGVQFRSTGRGSLVISRGSKLVATGTAAAPIVMSSIDSGYAGRGEWGGLVMQGFAKNNKCGEGSNDVLCNTADEAGTGFHGGNDDADSSGSVEYLIVAEGGYEVAPDSEVNGITLHSVGYGTKIENVMVYNNADDGIEFFGGAANVKNLILVDNGDESIDWDDGYRGNIQFSLVRQGVSAKGDHGIEADNKGRSTTATPTSNPTLANITFQQNVNGADDLFRFKEGTGAKLFQIAADNYSECVRVGGADTGQTQTIELTDVLLECVAYDDTTFLTLKDDAVATGVIGVPTASATVELGAAFEVTGNAAATLAAETTLPSANGSADFFTATDYIGAVAPTVTAAENAWWYWANAVVPAAFGEEVDNTAN